MIKNTEISDESEKTDKNETDKGILTKLAEQATQALALDAPLWRIHPSKDHPGTTG